MIINVPDKKITAKDSTMNVLAAVDIVEAKLNGQLRKYKTMCCTRWQQPRRTGTVQARFPARAVGDLINPLIFQPCTV